MDPWIESRIIAGGTPDGETDLATRWLALHEAAGLVAALAGLEPPAAVVASSAFAGTIARAHGWRRALAEQGLQDLVVIVQTGIAALLAAHGRCVPTGAAAGALLAEFATARDALVALCREPERMPSATA